MGRFGVKFSAFLGDTLLPLGHDASLCLELQGDKDLLAKTNHNVMLYVIKCLVKNLYSEIFIVEYKYTLLLLHW